MMRFAGRWVARRLRSSERRERGTSDEEADSSIGGVWAGAGGTVPVIKAKYDIAELTGPPTSEKAVVAAFFTPRDSALYVISSPGRRTK